MRRSSKKKFNFQKHLGPFTQNGFQWLTAKMASYRNILLLTGVLLECSVRHEILLKMWDTSATVKHVYKEKQWKRRAVKCKNTFCVNRPFLKLANFFHCHFFPNAQCLTFLHSTVLLLHCSKFMLSIWVCVILGLL